MSASSTSSLVCIALALQTVTFAAGVTYNFSELGGLHDDMSEEAAWANGRLFNKSLSNLASGDVLLFPNTTFYMMGGVKAEGLTNVTIQFDGTILFSKDMKSWPRDGATTKAHVHECMHFISCDHMTFTSSGKGLIDGNGAVWWGIPGIGYLARQENRPRLLNIENAKHNLVENIILKNSPYWTFWAHGVEFLEVRNVDISARRTESDGHGIIDLTAFNTDGFDVAGSYVWIHDCTVWNQDDCVCAKDGSQHMLFERINASGLGLTIGSIGGSTNKNITFRDIYMHKTYKGVYMKFRDLDNGGIVEDVLYENIVMDEPEQWGVWIGPAQQSDSDNLCAAHPCSICWPALPEKFAPCMSGSGRYRNITLRNITIRNSKKSPGVIIGNMSTPMTNLTFDNVKFVNPGSKPWGSDYYRCSGVQNGVAVGDTWPVPNCFKDMTNRSPSP
jgi:polygalacturonase|eukprot:g990.t1